MLLKMEMEEVLWKYHPDDPLKYHSKLKPEFKINWNLKFEKIYKSKNQFSNYIKKESPRRPSKISFKTKTRTIFF